jgi:hypothetical protein
VCRFFFIAESPLQGFHLNGFSHKQWHNFRGEGQLMKSRTAELADGGPHKEPRYSRGHDIE